MTGKHVENDLYTNAFFFLDEKRFINKVGLIENGNCAVVDVDLNRAQLKARHVDIAPRQTLLQFILQSEGPTRLNHPPPEPS